MKVLKFVASTVLVLVSASLAEGAAVTFSTGNASMNENVLFGHASCAGCVDGPATTIIGHGQNSNILVDFTSLTSLVASGANTITYNPANLTPGFLALNINVPGYYITGIMFQLTEIDTVNDGSVTLTANGQGIGMPISANFTLLHQGGGLNQFYMTSDSATHVTSLDILSTRSLHDISQVSISLQAVPEPTSFALLGAGLVALEVFRRRRS